MEFYGITHHGPQNDMFDIVRPEYKEPMKADEVEPMLKKVEAYSTLPKHIQRPDVNTFRVIDCYLGRVNGFAYGSTVRFIKMKRKGVIKPVGPCDIYRFPPTTSIDYGWWIHDPLLQNVDWTVTNPRSPQPSSPNTLILDAVRKNNKYATLF